MRISRVMSSDPACSAACPEWISAEGRIVPGSADAFEKSIAGLNGRRLPVIISSHGGSVSDAVRMGVVIRARGLVVAVARTVLASCPRGAQCPPRGQVITGGAYCASACPLILAGGVERLVGPVPMVGVHQITTVMKEVEGAAHLTTVKKIYEQPSADKAIEHYWTAMGIGDPVMALLRKTPAGDIRWLSLAEIRESRLATLALDFDHPIETAGANGLNGHAFDGEAQKPDLLTARGLAAGIEAALAYRRGGGVVEAAFRPAASSGPQERASTIENGGDPIALTGDGKGGAAADIPVAHFCALAKEGKIVVSSGASPSSSRTADFVLASMAGSGKIITEICP